MIGLVARPWHRRSIRLRGFNYGADGGYFVTLITHQRRHLFGTIREGRVTLSAAGQIARDAWYASATIRAEIFLDAFVVMPDHIHGIVVIRGDRVEGGVRAHSRAPRPASQRDGVRAHGRAPQQRTLGTFIRGYKADVTARVNTLRATPGVRVWQRNYYERIIWTDRAWAAIARYIADNPRKW